MKIISVLCPSRDRPRMALDFYQSVMRTANYKRNIEVLFYLDDDDPSLERYRELFDVYENCALVIGEALPLSTHWNVLLERSRGDIIIMSNDDVVYLTHGWDEILLEKVVGYEDELYCAWFDDGRAEVRKKNKEERNFCSFPIVSRRWCEVVGYLTPGLFHRIYNDNWISDLAEKISRQKYVPSVMTRHYHKRDDETAKRARADGQNAKDETTYTSDLAKQMKKASIQCLREALRPL